jgi:CDP-glycerol glycerophosphotransferase
VTVRPVPGEPSEVDFTARIPLDPIIDDANPDDPFTQRTSRGVQIVAGGSTRALMWMGPDVGVGEVHRDRLLMLTRSSGNFVNLHESLVRLGAEKVAVEDERLVFSGPLWEESAGMSFQWRRYLEDSDDHVDVECRRWISDGWWNAEVNLTDLIPEFRRVSVDPLASQAEWVLFATAADGSAKAVQSEPAMNGRLPIEITVGAADTVRISPRAGTLHLEVY